MRGKLQYAALCLLAVAIVLLLFGVAMRAWGQAPSSCAPTVIDQLGVMHPFAWLQAKYPGIRCMPVADPAREHFALTGIVYKSDPAANMVIYVKDAQGMPQIGQPTTYWYPDPANPSPDLATIPAAFPYRCAPRGVINKNQTDGDGKVSYEWGSSSWMNNGRGPYGAQVLSVSTPSECIDGIGWDPYTEHQGYVILIWRLIPAQTGPTQTPVTPTRTPVIPTPTPVPPVSPLPTPGPATVDLTETNNLLREILAAIKAGFRLP